jgi:hypothetical protein
MSTYIILDAKTTNLLEDKMSKYNISSLGSLTIQNTHYYQSFIGTPATEVITEVNTKVSTVPAKPKTPSKPAKRKSRAKVSPVKPKVPTETKES